MAASKAGNAVSLSGPRMTSEEIGLGALETDEEEWRDRYMYLQGHGYTLRPRFHPEWVPSWIGAENLIFDFEDSITYMELKVMDAMDTRRKNRVCIKLVPRETDEIKIACLLSSKEVSNSPTNHCVPILEVLSDPLSPSDALLVMPYLRPFDDPPFEIVEEIMDFVQQTLEGLCFIHSKGVAHRDCSTRNIMMDGSVLYPDDHHPVYRQLTPDISRYARRLSRTQRPVKYYYIDFGMSSYFKEGESPYVLGAKGADQDAPELSNERPYNAFMLDVFILGHMYETDLVQMYLDLGFLEPLVSAMTNQQPERRPTAEAALRMFHDIRRGLNTTHLRWRIRNRDESGAERVVYDTISAAKVGFGLVRRGLMGN